MITCVKEAEYFIHIIILRKGVIFMEMTREQCLCPLEYVDTATYERAEEASAKVMEHLLEHPEMWENLTYEEWDQLYTKIGYGLEKEDLIDLSKYEDLEEKERRYSEYVKKNYEEWIKMTPKEQLVITKKIYRGEIKP